MRPMEKQQLVKELTDFLKNEKGCIEALACLNEKAEVAINIAGAVELSVSYKDSAVVVEERKAFSADFRFHASPEAIEVLIAEKGLSPAQLGIKLVKQVISRDISISMPGSIFQIPRKGYLNIVKVGGVEFLAELKKHNMASVPKILGALKKLKRS